MTVSERPVLPPVPPGSVGAPPGMYQLAGQLFLRRFAPVKPQHMSCRLGHELTLHGHPFAGVQQCDTHGRSGNQRCPAHIYYLQVTDRHYWLLDVTPGEALWLRRTRATPDEVFAWFGLDLQPPL